jgi:acetyl-CoA carboxylase carboxyltransferase component
MTVTEPNRSGARPALPAPPRPVERTLRDLTGDVAEKRRLAVETSAHATAQQRAKGKGNARERLALLFDAGTFVELDTFRRHRSQHFQLVDRRPHTDGVITGWGRIHGRVVFAYAQDFRIFGGSLGEEHASKIHKVMDLAYEARKPLIALNDSGGARIQEGVCALAGYGGMFRRNVRASGVIPQISVIMGPCAGGAAYSPSLTDFTFMIEETSQMFITGPSVLKAAVGESVTADELGGAKVHATESGVAHLRYTSEAECLEDVRFLLSLLPESVDGPRPDFDVEDRADRSTPELLDLVPASPRHAYDMRRVIDCLVDGGEAFEVHEEWGQSLICALARLGGRTVGVVANQPRVRAGVLDIDSSSKGARFVQMCDSFRIPLLTLVDVPGFLPGVDQEHNGIIRHGAKLLYAYCAATVPRISLVLRKAYGGAYIVMDSRSIGADLAFAWPSNEIAVMGADGAVDVLFSKDLAAAIDPEQTRRTLIDAYTDEFLTPLYAAERGLVDDVIDPARTRTVLIDAFEVLAHKGDAATARRHGNPPQ